MRTITLPNDHIRLLQSESLNAIRQIDMDRVYRISVSRPDGAIALFSSIPVAQGHANPTWVIVKHTGDEDAALASLGVEEFLPLDRPDELILLRKRALSFWTPNPSILGYPFMSEDEISSLDKGSYLPISYPDKTRGTRKLWVPDDMRIVHIWADDRHFDATLANDYMMIKTQLVNANGNKRTLRRLKDNSA